MDLNVYIQSIVLCVLNILNISAGVVLNLLVILSFWKSSPDLRKKLCYFMIMVLSCFDFLVVITTIPVVIIHLILWLDENYDALTVSRTYEKLSSLFPCFSFVVLLVLSFERYLGAYYPFFHRTSGNRRRLLTLLAVLLIVPTVIISISVNDLVISFPVALIIFLGIAFPPFVFINYRLFKISRKMRRDNAASPEATVHVNLLSFQLKCSSNIDSIHYIGLTNSFDQVPRNIHTLPSIIVNFLLNSLNAPITFVVCATNQS